MNEYLTEKEQLEAARKWWGENGRFVISGVVLGVGVLFGWNYWKSYQTNYAQSASALHEQLMSAVSDDDSANALAVADQLRSDFGRSIYADQALLAVARLQVEQGDLDAGATALETALGVSGEIGVIARLRLARIRLSQDRAEDALTLANAASSVGKFAALFDDIRGDANVALGNNDAARAAYQKVLDDADAIIDRAFVTMKFEALGTENTDE